MVALKLGAAALALLVASSTAADPVDRWGGLIDDASRRCGVPTSWISQVMRAESAGLTIWNGRPIRSRVGAIGLMQLMPATWAEMRSRLALGADPDEPRDNILAGSCYLRLLYDRFGYPALFAAYNAGPARYGAYLAGRAALPAETIAYLGNVSRPVTALRRARVTPSSAMPALFAIRRDVTGQPPAAGNAAQDRAIFALWKPQP